MPWQFGQPHVFQRMAVGPVPDIVQERRGEKGGGVGRGDGGTEAVVVLQPAEELECEPIGAERVLEP